MYSQLCYVHSLIARRRNAEHRTIMAKLLEIRLFAFNPYYIRITMSLKLSIKRISLTSQYNMKKSNAVVSFLLHRYITVKSDIQLICREWGYAISDIKYNSVIILIKYLLVLTHFICNFHK